MQKVSITLSAADACRDNDIFRKQLPLSDYNWLLCFLLTKCHIADVTAFITNVQFLFSFEM